MKLNSFRFLPSKPATKALAKVIQTNFDAPYTSWKQIEEKKRK